MQHLDLLINCVKSIYVPTTERLLPLLEYGEITYDLLWALFKPNTPICATCFGTKNHDVSHIILLKRGTTSRK